MSAGSGRVSVAIAALGGQGGGVLSGWLVSVAGRQGHLAQSTSVPGVAQRTGATLYYLEFFPKAAIPADGRLPVMALMPTPGDVDVVVATELVEAGRVLHRGIVTRERTTLISSTHRAYTIGEKGAMGDGRVDAAPILEAAAGSAKRLLAFDLEALAARHGAVISAVALGAIAGSDVLPFAVDAYRQVIRDGGVAVDTNLAGFDAGYAAARGSPQEGSAPAATVPATLTQAWRDRIRGKVSPAAWNVVEHGVAKLIDYQDDAYAAEFVQAVMQCEELEPDGHTQCRLTCAYAQGLALWMALEDTIRVADLKTRASRLEQIRREQRVRPGQVLHIREFLKPRMDEICGTLPAPIGRYLRASPWWHRRLAPLTRGLTISPTTVSGYLALRAVAGMRRWRRATLRYIESRSEREEWARAVRTLAGTHYELAVEVALSQRLAKGYGDTYERGLRNLRSIIHVADQLAGRPDAASQVARLRAAALADENGQAFGQAVSMIGAQD